MGWGGEVSLSQKRAEQSQVKSRSRWVTKQETDLLEKGVLTHSQHPLQTGGVIKRPVTAAGGESGHNGTGGTCEEEAFEERRGE